MIDAIERVRAIVRTIDEYQAAYAKHGKTDEVAELWDSIGRMIGRITVGNFRELLAIAEARGWRSMESCPSDDKTIVLLRIEWSHIPVVGTWDGKRAWAETEHYKTRCGAYCYGGEPGTQDGIVAIGWQPLPPPPKESA